MTASFVLGATVAQAAGWGVMAMYLMLAAAFLAMQTGMSALVSRVAARRD